MMKNAIVVFIVLSFPLMLNAQNVGIGTATPSEKLEVDGAINIGTNAGGSPEAGTIRWNDTTQDFEGYNGTEWVSLTKSNSSWGNPPTSSSIENNKLIPSDAFGNDQFGWNVSISGDFTIVGAPLEAANAGSAYIFSRSGNIWTEQAKLTASLPDFNDNFGWSVSIEGNYAIVGTTRDDDGGVDAGAAYIFVKPGGGWATMTETAKLTAFDPAASDQFGVSVSISGDIAVVGAYKDDDVASGSGSSYLFVKPGGGWVSATETAKLTASDPDINDQFGYSVSISGDFAVIGAHTDDESGTDAGAAYIFEKPGGGWVTTTETAKLTATDSDTDDQFGNSVSISGDFVLVGAHSDNEFGSNAGAAYIFEKPGGGWINMTETAKLTASDASAIDRFGTSVAISGDNVIIGAYIEDNVGGESAGSAYIFEKPIGGWTTMTQSAKLIASDGAPGDVFGYSVSISGNYALVGARSHDAVEINSGAVYIYH